MAFRLGQVVIYEGQRARIILLGHDYATIQFAGGRREVVSLDSLEGDCNCGRRR